MDASLGVEAPMDMRTFVAEENIAGYRQWLGEAQRE